MRKNMLMLLAAALLVVTGCKKDNNTENNNGEKMIFTATIDNGAKTQINGYDQVWNSGDKVSINGGEFTVTPKAGDESWATFEGQTVEPVGGMYKAIFPNSYYVSEDLYELPATQIYSGDNLSGVNPLYAQSETQELVFHNICALMKLNLIGNGTDKVTEIKVTADQDLSGQFEVKERGDSYFAELVQSRGENGVTLKCGDGVALTAQGTTFYIAIPEYDDYSNLTFTATTSEGKTWTYKANGGENIGIFANKLYESTQTPVFTPAGTYPGLCFTAEQAGSKVSMKINGSLTSNPALETSTDGDEWEDYDFTENVGETITLANVGDKVYFRRKAAATTFSSSNSKYAYFVMTGKIAASGNVMSLLDPKCEATTISSGYCFGHLFYNCISLTTAPELPATTLDDNCYYCMFEGCSSLTTAPELPAESLTVSCYSAMFKDCSSLTSAPVLNATSLGIACYVGMFNGCTSLATAPVLPATTLVNSCYADMFNGCSSLTAAPALPVATLANNCYQRMFNGCSSLETAPALPATTLANYCYQEMFSGCTSLAAAPALPATTLATNCYKQMFKGCTSLATAPALPATTLATNCYQEMFSACSKLNYIKVHFTAWDSNTTNWVKDVPTGGTFHCPSDLPQEYDSSKIPTDWTVETF